MPPTLFLMQARAQARLPVLALASPRGQRSKPPPRVPAIPSAAAAASSSSAAAATPTLPAPPAIDQWHDIGGAAATSEEKDANYCGVEGALKLKREWREIEATPTDDGGSHGKKKSTSTSTPNKSGTPLARRDPSPSSSTTPPKGLYHIHTFGCQMNVADSERMAGALEAAGWAQSQSGADGASVIIYNTCSIRDKAEQKVYSALGKQAKRKRAVMSRKRQAAAGAETTAVAAVPNSAPRTNASALSPAAAASPPSDLKLVLAGCVGSQEGAALLRRVPELDLVMGPHHANRIAELLERVDLGQQVVAVDPVEIEEDVALPRRGSTLTAWVNASFGCNEACTYCVVPRTRGAEQSRKPEDIRREMLSLGEAGYKEVTLLGQNIDAYGRDLPGAAADGSGRRAWTFTDLLRHVHDVPGIERIRFATSHPRYFTERLIRACAELPKLCEFFHVPFQSGDDVVLREMARGYTAARYRRVADAIRRHMPDASISGDAIVGFPGETEEQFEATARLVREVGFDRVNTAAFSPRPGTAAAERGDQVADLVKADRLRRLNAVVDEVAEERARRFLGRELELLVEGVNPKLAEARRTGAALVGGSAFGRSRHNKLVFFDGDGEDLKGSTVTVRVERVHAYSLFGEMTGVAKRA